MAEEEAKCPKCHGKPWRQSGIKALPCGCIKEAMLAHYLGPDLYGAARITRGPLYSLDANFNVVTLDRTKENLFIKSRWPALLPHLRLAMGHRYYLNEAYQFAVLTDERIINVFVGNESWKARSGRGHEANVNGLKDLVEDPNLVVIRLGFLGWRNIAAPGALKQALMLREAALRPTWVVRESDRECHSWNEEVAAYIQEHHDDVNVDEPTSPSMDVEVEEPRQVKRAKRIEAQQASTDLLGDPEGLAEGGPTKRYGGSRRYKKRDSGGGGPV